ncbi:hypothetical protein [Runella slithyformis]|uniref:Uncharacterized protein n=1 Tax=Runella slithyformis (strain ATCC 29530 / DSM 19594 / LMG 11500 / NCIMB 11436 / LSU 4) TaxID=761193 RepID=A0A7U4E6F9_RUNSL|nr:hypothetical protein [Runella slithyformis]AEI49556.1 hypothetical protein Runsl_3177 [Runella slithyformis DSM 19594]
MYNKNSNLDLSKYSVTSLNQTELIESNGGDQTHYGFGYAVGLYVRGAVTAAEGLWSEFNKWRESNIEKYGTAGH